MLLGKSMLEAVVRLALCAGLLYADIILLYTALTQKMKGLFLAIPTQPSKTISFFISSLEY